MANKDFKTPVKLQTLVGKPVEIRKLIWLNSRFGEYALIIRSDTDAVPAVSTSNEVVLKQLRELEKANKLPCTMNVAEREGQKYKYLVLE